MNQGINLRPWREERREKRQKQFTQLSLMACLLGLLISGLAYYSSQQALAALTQENQMIQQNTRILDLEIAEVGQLRQKKDTLLHRIQVIEGLQAHRFQTLDIFDQLAASNHDGVQLTAARRQGRELQLQGWVYPTPALSAWMRQLESQEAFRAPLLRSINAEENTLSHRFNLMVPLAF